MLVVDLDDTLLTDDRTVTDATRAALAEAAARGVVVTLATGRMYASARRIAESLRLDVPIITYQGALVKTLDGRVLYERTVPRDVAERFWQYCKQNRLHLHVYHDDTLYVPEDNDKSREYAALSEVPFVVEPNLGRLIGLPLPKMLVVDDPERLDRIMPELRDMFGDRAHITKSKPHYLEVLHPEATKGHAIRFLAAHFGCDMKEVIAVGDSWNDRDMIEAAGLGVAMGNAVEPLKAVADFITATNNEDGVRLVVERFILGREPSTTPSRAS
ncbi:MAG: hydrolase [Candidatus Reconcilbacillus cellulovorans]|uniref:Hydrolase n=1 Tax=Candidatus Reconcilbacillus cellulovorans TaxID=1906605 RepID=A0A2A6E063_9BACL|nr:MAG: hydrolase [Candidatus Reconcilbacillus cellulovorans]